MYGTIARLRVKTGMEARMRDEFKEATSSGRISGMVFDHLYQSTTDPNEFWLVVGFESKDAYDANATSPEQHEEYLRLRAILDADPEWHDGTIVESAALAGI